MAKKGVHAKKKHHGYSPTKGMNAAQRKAYQSAYHSVVRGQRISHLMASRARALKSAQASAARARRGRSTAAVAVYAKTGHAAAIHAHHSRSVARAARRTLNKAQASALVDRSIASAARKAKTLAAANKHLSKAQRHKKALARAKAKKMAAAAKFRNMTRAQQKAVLKRKAAAAAARKAKHGKKTPRVNRQAVAAGLKAAHRIPKGKKTRHLRKSKRGLAKGQKRTLARNGKKNVHAKAKRTAGGSCVAEAVLNWLELFGYEVPVWQRYDFLAACGESTTILRGLEIARDMNLGRSDWEWFPVKKAVAGCICGYESSEGDHAAVYMGGSCAYTWGGLYELEGPIEESWLIKP